MKHISKISALLLSGLLVLGIAACKNTTVSTGSENTEIQTAAEGPGQPPEGRPGGAPGGSSSSDLEYTGAVTITSSDTQSGQSYTSTASDESALLIATSEEVSITDPTVSKTGD